MANNDYHVAALETLVGEGFSNNKIQGIRANYYECLLL